MTVNKLPHVQGIYKIIFPNGKIYIGLSKDIHVRIKEHLAKDYYEHPELPISKVKNIIQTNITILLEKEGVLKLQQEFFQRKKYYR